MGSPGYMVAIVRVGEVEVEEETLLGAGETCVDPAEA